MKHRFWILAWLAAVVTFCTAINVVARPDPANDKLADVLHVLAQRDGQGKKKEEALQQLVQLGIKGHEQRLADVLTQGGPASAWVAEAAGRWGFKAMPLARPLANRLIFSDVDAPVYAYALARMKAVEELSRVLGSETKASGVRAAADAISRIGPQAGVAAPALVSLVNNEVGAEILIEVVRALGSIAPNGGGSTSAVLDSLVLSLSHADAGIRHSAAESLGLWLPFARDSARTIAPLIRAFKDGKSAIFRGTCARILGTSRHQRSAIALALLPALDDTNIGKPVSRALLHLGVCEPRVMQVAYDSAKRAGQLQAAKALACCGSKGRHLAVDLLQRGWGNWRGNQPARVEACDLLGVIGTANVVAARSTLALGAEDPDATVRLAARTAQDALDSVGRLAR